MARRSKTSRTKVREISQAKNRKITNTSPNGKRTQISGLTEVTRLKRELEETLQQQTATENILKVISSSPDNVQPVFDAIVNSAAMLFAQCTAVITTVKDDKLQWNALATLRSDFDISGAKAVYPLPFDPDRSPSARAILEHRIIEIPDTDAPDTPEYTRKASATGSFRSATFVPLVHHGRGIGTIILTHPQAGFRLSERQLALVKTFADQAVIAIENARLFHETQEALERQTATASILSVISHSVADTQPVFEEILRSIAGPFDAEERCILLIDEDGLLHIGAYHGPGVERARALFPRPIKGTATETAVRERRLIQYPDVFNGPDVPPGLRDYARGFGRNYSLIVAPMLREDRPIGAILINSAAMRVFSERECALLETFADQAVIAIENARLFDEVQAKTRDLEEALEQESAGSEVLKLISMSSGDLEPVFQKLLESATRLCGAEFGIMNLLSGGMVRQVSFYNMPEAYVSEWSGKQYPPHPESVMGTVMRTRQAVHVDDLRTRPAYLARNPAVVALSDIAGARTYVGVPLLQRDELVGMISIYRREVRPFDEKQVQLVERFASQAVIALENARLLNELRERTHQLSRSLENLRAAQDRLVQTEKLASLGQLTAGIAHEIKNPLNFVNNFSGLSVELVDELAEGLEGLALDENRRAEFSELTETLRENLKKVVQHGKRADAIVKNMLLHSRQGSGEYRRVEVNALVEESLSLAYHGARAEKQGFEITLEKFFDPAAGEAELFPQEITRVLLNLISNGVYAAMKRKAEALVGYEPALVAATRSLGNNVEISIRDNGGGIPPELKEENLQSILYDQATRRRDRSWPVPQLRHYRQTTLGIDRGRYSTWRIYRIQDHTSAQSRPQQSRSEFMSFLVLVVDDEPDVEMLFRQQFRRDLRDNRFKMDFAQSAASALQRISDAAGESLILILSDINMPGMSGLELLPRAKAARPDVPVIMITAYGDDTTRRKALEGGAEALLTKPIDFVALRTEIDGRVASAA
jgi:two-component system, NtrC family, sensor kinase